MKKKPDYATMGLKALRRAAAKVARDANQKGYKIPYWENGRIIYKIPDMPAERPFEDSISEQK